MRPASELAERALDLGRNVAKQVYGPDVFVQAETASTGWHDTLHRQVFEQLMSLWTSLSLLDVIANGMGQVVGFVDHEAYRRADDDSTLGEDDVRGIVADSEFLPPRSRIQARTTYPGPEGGRLEAVTVEGQTPGGTRRWLVEINIARRLIASVRPIELADTRR